MITVSVLCSESIATLSPTENAPSVTVPTATVPLPPIEKTSSTTNEISEYFDYSDEKVPELTKDEKDTYGNREMKGYQKQRLLGK